MHVNVALASDNLQSMRKYGKQIKQLNGEVVDIEIDLEDATASGDKHTATKLRRKLKATKERLENAQGMYRSSRDLAAHERNKK